jgi:signal transduction histidine kinase
MRTVWAVSFAALLALVAWTRTLSGWALLAALVLLVAAAALELRRPRDVHRRVALPLALAALTLALAAAGATTVRLEQGERSWQEVQTSREHRLAARLEGRMHGIIRRTTAAAELAAGVAADWGREAAAPTLAPGAWFVELESIRQRTGVDAVALVDRSGRAVAWAGDHRGQLPGSVVRRDGGIVYPGGTLFSYLYAVEPVGIGLNAVSAVLVQAGPPVRGRTGAVAERFEAVTGERPRFGPGPAAEADWTLSFDGEAVLHARWPALDHGEWRTDVSRTGRRVVFALALLALGLLWSVWLRSIPDRGAEGVLVPMGALVLTLVVAPLRRIIGAETLFSPGFFLLPVPGDVLIESVLVVLLPMAALVSTFRPDRARPSELWLRLAIGAALAGGAFAVGAGLMAASAGYPMLTTAGPLWYVLMPTTVVLLAVLSAPLVPRAHAPDPGRRALVYAAAGIVLSLALAVALARWWRPGGPSTTPLLLLWAVPFLLTARAVAGYAGQGDRLIRWLAVGWIASTAVIPYLWVVNQSTKLAAAETEVEAFGARTDPYLTYLLVRFGEELERAAARGERGGDLLYEAWVASGLASEPYPLEISLWDAELRREAYLPLGVRLEPGSPAELELREILRATVVRDEPENMPATGGGVGRFLTVPLRRGGAVSVAVAPRASLRPASPLSMLMDGGGEGVRLELLPIGGMLAHDDAAWRRTDQGWRKEMMLREGRDVYHAHLELRIPPAGVRLARGMLLGALALGLLAALWAAGRFARGDPPTPAGGWLGWLGGFRARLIVALFAFFLLPTAVFGWAAYRALAEEVTRAARQVAERAVVHAAAVLPGAGIEETSRRAGEDLLYYQRGMLRAASMSEAQELGLYSAWLPAPVYRAIRAGEAMGGSEMGELAGRSYMVSYRRFQSAEDVVAVPVWLAARDVAVRQREFAHLVLFGVMVGGILSLVLSVLVGRAFARPIAELRRAAAAVGRGHLRVRLPEQRADEFGELFASFNRMTRRLRRARAQEVRTARILAWGEMARQVAHEIKNPLTPIKLSVQHLRRAYQDGRPDYDAILESNVDQILVEIDRLTEIARVFSRYGAPPESPGATEPVDVAGVVREVLTLYRAPDRSVRYRFTIESEETVAAARPAELREVLVNLLENARAAVGEAGQVDVRVVEAGRFIRVDVRDDGHGIPPDQLPHIFEPHFSTRSSGTGLGLAIVRRIVEGWGGEVDAVSEPSRGTTVRVLVPRLRLRREEGDFRGDAGGDEDAADEGGQD